MTDSSTLARILVIDDLFGRTLPDRRNRERASLCGKFLLEDVTGDEEGKGTPQRIHSPVAQAVFVRGQKPKCSFVGDTVENELEGTLKIIRSCWTDVEPGQPCWAMVLLDLCFYTGAVTEESNSNTPGMPEGRAGDNDPNQYFGLQLLEAIHSQFPDLPVVILSSMPRDEVSHQFSAKGALGFVPRSEAKSTPELLREYLWRHALLEDETGEVVGRSRALLVALRSVRRVAHTDDNVLIRGERGVGKELMAHYLHRQRQSDRSSKPLVTVNSAVLTRELYASELFGVEKSVATGVDKRDGFIKTADGSDLFFDEIRDLVPEAQAGILRVLEEDTITPVGSRRPQEVSVRFLSATNADIEALSASGRFREDLLDRLRAGGTVILPPLRERKEDIPLLVEKFVREAEQATKALRRYVDPCAMERFCAYDWPGNVRELRSCIFKAIRDNADVEHLVPAHIEYAEKQEPSLAQPTRVTRETSLISTSSVSPPEERQPVKMLDSDIDAIISALSNIEFDATKPEQLSGQLEQLQGATSSLLASYLKAALVATRRPTPEHPEGEIKIHPAVKLITGDSKISASKAADIIKRLLNLALNSNDLITSDSILATAYEKARRLRPSYPKKKQSKSSSAFGSKESGDSH